MADGYTFDSISQSLSALGSASSDLVQLSLTGRDSYVRPKTDYSIFSDHVFFGDAKRKFSASLTNIIDNYPIGKNATDILSLCAQNIYLVDKFYKESTGFDKWLLEELSKGTFDGKKYSVTASAVNDQGETVSLILIDRDIDNNIIGDQVSLLTEIEKRVNKYEVENKIIIDQTSGTSSYYLFSSTGSSRKLLFISPTAEYNIKRTQKLHNMVPQYFFEGDQKNNLEKLLSVWAEIIDDLKLYIDNIPNLKNLSYEEYNTIPDKFLPVIAKEYGINLFDGGKIFDVSKSLVNSSASGYTSQRITYTLWRRIVNNMMLLLKTKGTKECLDIIARLYGIDENLIKINEYSFFNGPNKVREVNELPSPILYSNGSWYIQTTTDAVDSSSLYFDFPSGQDFTIQARVSVTSEQEHIIFEHPYYNIKINNDNTLQFNSITTPSVQVQTSLNETLSAFMRVPSNFVNIAASRSGDNLNIYLMALSGSSTGGNDIVASAKATYNNVNVGLEDYNSQGGTVGGATNFPGISNFNGYIHQIRTWDAALTDADLIEHTKNFESVSINNSLTATSPVSFSNLKSHFKLKENLILQSPYDYIVNSVFNSKPAIPINFGTTENHYNIFNTKRITNIYPIGMGADNDRIRQEDNIDDTQKDVGYISFSFNPLNSLNRLIKNYIQDVNLYDLMGEPLDHNSHKYQSNFVIKWHELTNLWGIALNKTYDSDPLLNEIFKSGGGDPIDPNTVGATGNMDNITDYNNFIKSMSNFDDIFGGMFKFYKQFIPAKTSVLAEGVYIEPHILERSKIKRTFGYRVENIIDIDENSFTAGNNVISYDEGKTEYNAIPSLVVFEPTMRTINNHFLIGDLSITGSGSANVTDLAASAATTATFQGFQYKDNNIQSYFDNNYSTNSQMNNLKTKSSVNKPTFSQARYGRISPINVTPASPQQSEIDITLDQYIISPIANPSSQRGFISGRVRMIVGGEDFKTDNSSISFEFPASGDGTNLFVAEIGDIDAGKGRIVKDKDLSLTIPLDTKNVRFLLKLSDVVTSLSAVGGSVTQAIVDDTVSGSLGIVPIKVNNLFNNKSYIFRVAINSDSTKDTDFIRQITQTGIEKLQS